MCRKESNLVEKGGTIMQATPKRNINKSTVTVNTNSLAEVLDCGRATAVKIGDLAGARVQIGKRVLWNLNKVRDYIDVMSI